MLGDKRKVFIGLKQLICIKALAPARPTPCGSRWVLADCGLRGGAEAEAQGALSETCARTCSTSARLLPTTRNTPATLCHREGCF